MILDNTRPRRALTRRALLMALGLSAAALVPLAVLRPGARAAAPGTSPRHVPEAVIYLPAGVPVAGFLAVNGLMTVQLSGIGSLKTQKWWNAYGAPLARPVYAIPSALSSGGLPSQRSVQLAFRLPPDAQGVTVKYALTDCLNSSSGGSWHSKIEGHDRQNEAQLNAQTGGARIVTATFPASISKTNVRIGLASGPWIVIGTTRRDASGQIASLSLQRGHTGYIFSTLAETKEGTMLTISVNASVGTSAEDLRIVAVDIQGREVLPAEIGDRSIGALDQITAQFGLPPSQIKEVRLESRLFRYIEFKNVALRPIR